MNKKKSARFAGMMITWPFNFRAHDNVAIIYDSVPDLLRIVEMI